MAPSWLRFRNSGWGIAALELTLLAALLAVSILGGVSLLAATAAKPGYAMAAGTA